VVENGTEFYNRDSSGYDTWQTGKKIVVDDWDERIHYVPEDWAIRVGVNEPLPEFEGIDLDISAEDTRDKAILLYFFDMNQRPSRNCLLQLSNKSQEFKARDIVVAAIHVSKIDKSNLNAWISEHKIPFTVGMVKGDEEKTRFTWGVRSLPWLILTDREHIVRAEGFGIERLDEILQGVENNP
jgi:peroxiredoxin